LILGPFVNSFFSLIDRWSILSYFVCKGDISLDFILFPMADKIFLEGLTMSKSNLFTGLDLILLFRFFGDCEFLEDLFDEKLLWFFCGTVYLEFLGETLDLGKTE